jgi:2',3'-cyclic-nucleotide 2'-phosphodiesterase (5'-nucleotidase family)
MIYKIRFFYLFIAFAFFSCSKDGSSITDLPIENNLKKITIFHINDVHGSIDNFAKIKYLVDEEKKKTNVLFVCAGDTFSGNPVVDFYNEKGYPMIDLMNKAGVDIAVLGNHEFDYGETILNNRINQSHFEWICANLNTDNSPIQQPQAYSTININDINVTFLGLIQTSESNNRLIPATHPWRVKNIEFTHYSDVIRNYSSLKRTENSDIYIGLTHLGLNTDTSIAENHPFFDIIIGGHSHSEIAKKENNTYIYQAGSYLRNLGKIKVTIDNEGIITTNHELINLSTVTEYDASIKTLIDNYNDNPEFDEVIGFAEENHNKNEVGNFYTEALLNEMSVDLTFQNSGGIRSTLDEGDITIREIYAIDPFNNGSVTYTMTVGEVKTFFKNSGEGLYYAGLTIEQSGNSIIIKDENGDVLSDNTSITIGVNDFIPAVNNSYFTSTATIKEFTTAETIINYLKKNSAPINYTGYNNYFKFN